MRIHRTTSQDVWNRVKTARRVLRDRHHCPPDRDPARHKVRVRAKAYFAKMRGMPGKGTEIFPVEILWSFIGSLAGMTVLALVNTEVFGRADNLLLMGTFGASAMLLFGAPQVPFAQPRNVIGGHVVSALVGITVYTLCGESSLVGPALGVAGAIAAMHATGTLHPPGGGTALMMATGDQSVIQYGYLAVLFPVATATIVLVAVALITNNLARDRRYPVSWW
ncbi:Transmembrane protein DDB_G0273707/DDB_G0273361 (fragment) [uncultured delta proteobacterium]|uniref:Transmembrane protein DDB_G0273707/DDB_G0273361 n=1 Tax=uncultured delta proteobacterium TaxID=34034 RepID=A0A212JLC1_9DELT